MFTEISGSQRRPLGSIPTLLSPLCKGRGITAMTWLGIWLVKLVVFKSLRKPVVLGLLIQLLSLVSRRFHLASSPTLVRAWSENVRQ